MSHVVTLSAKKILDSRGEWTIECTMTSSDGVMATVSVPQGKSRGSFEAVSIEPDKAMGIFKGIIEPALTGGEIALGGQAEIDKKLIALDGTPNKAKLGGNTTLAISLAYARLASHLARVPLWQGLKKIGQNEDAPLAFPRLFVNMVNGGVHAGSGLAFQEYLAIPVANRPSEAIPQVLAVYQKLKAILLERKGAGAINVGDEGGFTPQGEDEEEPFTFMKEAVVQAGFADQIEFGLDAAASQVNLLPHELLSLYTSIKEHFPCIYLEDPYGENDFAHFATVMKHMGHNTLIAGDDLTVTSVARMEEAQKQGSINAMVIKPNQIGTMTETFDAVRKAREFGWRVVVSHRSGETNDDWVSDLACAVNADGFKLGAPARGERITKYNRLLAIEREVT